MFPLNLPNVLTVLRIMLVPVLVVALLGDTPAGDVLAAVVFALASLTAFVDGYLARAHRPRLAAAPAGVDRDGHHHARARRDGPADGRDAGGRGDGREHVRQG